MNKICWSNLIYPNSHVRNTLKFGNLVDLIIQTVSHFLISLIRSVSSFNSPFFCSLKTVESTEWKRMASIQVILEQVRHLFNYSCIDRSSVLFVSMSGASTVPLSSKEVTATPFSLAEDKTQPCSPRVIDNEPTYGRRGYGIIDLQYSMSWFQ